MKHFGLALCLIATPALTLAQVAVRPRPPVAPREAPIEVRPGAVPQRGAQKAAPAQSLETFKATVGTTAGAAAVTSNEQQKSAAVADSCSVAQFGEQLAHGTRFKPEHAAYVVSRGIVSKGVCGGNDGVLQFPVDARENLIEAGAHVAQSLNGKAVKALNQDEISKLDVLWAEGLAKAKNRSARPEDQVSVASQIAVAKEIKERCQLRF